MFTCLLCNLQCLYFTKLQSRSVREWGRKERSGCNDRLNVGKERQKWRKKCRGILLSRRKEATRIARWEGRNGGYMKAVISADSNSKLLCFSFWSPKWCTVMAGETLGPEGFVAKNSMPWVYSTKYLSCKFGIWFLFSILRIILPMVLSFQPNCTHRECLKEKDC